MTFWTEMGGHVYSSTSPEALSDISATHFPFDFFPAVSLSGCAVPLPLPLGGSIESGGRSGKSPGFTLPSTAFCLGQSWKLVDKPHCG